LLVQAEQLVVAENMDKEYAAITGVADFRRLAAELAYSPSAAPLQDKRVRSQSCLAANDALE